MSGRRTMSNPHSDRMLATAVAAAVGVIGAVGLFIYQQVSERQRTMKVRQDLDKMSANIAELQSELENLRLHQAQRRSRDRPVRRRINRKNGSTYTATDNDTDADAFSTAADTDFDDDEFFDFSDMDSRDGDNERRTSETTNELDTILAEADVLYEAAESNTNQVLKSLIDLLKTHPDNVEIIWRVARACHKCSTNMTDSEGKRKLITKGIEVCESIPEPDNANYHKWFAILIGSYGMYLPTKAKIESGHRFRKHVDKAMKLRPNDAGLYHLLGRFKYEVASLSWIERKLASTLFAEPPSATFEEAISDFQRGEELSDKPFKENKFLLAKSWAAINHYQEAIRWLKEAEKAPTLSEEDRVVNTEVEQLLTKYSKYRT